MQDFASSFQNALRLILTGDPDLLEIVLLSLWVSIGAVLIAALIALPLRAALALARFRGRGVVIVVLNATMGLPPVVVGLVVYRMLSASGPLGVLGLRQGRAGYA